MADVTLIRHVETLAEKSLTWTDFLDVLRKFLPVAFDVDIKDMQRRYSRFRRQVNDLNCLETCRSEFGLTQDNIIKDMTDLHLSSAIGFEALDGDRYLYFTLTNVRVHHLGGQLPEVHYQISGEGLHGTIMDVQVSLLKSHISELSYKLHKQGTSLHGEKIFTTPIIYKLANALKRVDDA